MTHPNTEKPDRSEQPTPRPTPSEAKQDRQKLVFFLQPKPSRKNTPYPEVPFSNPNYTYFIHGTVSANNGGSIVIAGTAGLSLDPRRDCRRDDTFDHIRRNRGLRLRGEFPADSGVDDDSHRRPGPDHHRVARAFDGLDAGGKRRPRHVDGIDSCSERRGRTEGGDHRCGRAEHVLPPRASVAMEAHCRNLCGPVFLNRALPASAFQDDHDCEWARHYRRRPKRRFL